jgi:hypothetical protein
MKFYYKTINYFDWDTTIKFAFTIRALHIIVRG